MRRKAPEPRRLAKLSRNMQLSFVKAHGLRRVSDEGKGKGKKKTMNRVVQLHLRQIMVLSITNRTKKN